jgi:hypothetical protein
MASLIETVKTEVEKYAGDGFNVRLIPLLDDERRHYGIIAVDYPTRKEVATVAMMARVVGNQVVIEEDMTDKKLIDALLQAGIPRDQIILAYAGEPVPES